MNKGEIHYRPLAQGDISGLRRLFELTYQYEPVSDGIIHEKTFQDPFFENSLTWVATRGEQIVGFAMGVTRPDYKPEKGWLKLIAVHPEFQGQGIGKVLFGRIESAFQQRNLTVMSLFDTPYNYYTPGLDPRYTRALVFFQDRGFERTGETENLLCSLDQSFDTAADEKRLAGKGIEILLAEETHLPELNKWLETIWPAWIYEATAAWRQNLLYLAIKKDAGVIGFGAGEDNNVGTGWFGPVGVDPKFRQYKIGKVLSLKVLHDLKKRGFAMAIIPWVGPIPFYQRLCKAMVDRVFWRFEKQL
ncbi:MAG: GNAT family N-acetyltransferase [Candidatus Marinimicrobia bacterium]|nr:GNAT family N-acetyltransferase [Candidatus Neomarinimicrobiota bacterium]MCF7902501.1 GNAT family N-acetyltransferase [Candidatus Neomarinimicrobiota bacterium]